MADNMPAPASLVPLPDEILEQYERDLKQSEIELRTDLELWFTQEVDRADGADKSAELAIQWKWFYLESFYHNKQFMTRVPGMNGQADQIYANTWETQETDEGRMRYLTNNQVRRDGNTLISQCALSNPVPIFRGRSGGDKGEDAALFAKTMWNYHRDRYLGISFRLERAKMAVIPGCYFGRWSYNPDAGTRTQDIYEPIEQDVDLGSATHMCPDCQTTTSVPDEQESPQAEAQEGESPAPQSSAMLPQPDLNTSESTEAAPNPGIMQPCPACGQAEKPLEFVSRNTGVKPVSTLVRREKLGDFCFEVIHPRNIKVDLTSRYFKGTVKSTPWLLHRYLSTTEQTEEEFDYVKVKATGAMSQAMLYAKRLQSATGYMGMDGGQVGDSGAYTHQVERRDLYMDPSMYSRRTALRYLKIGDVEFMPGDKIIDKFPDGMVIKTSGQQLLAVQGVDKNKIWTWGNADLGADHCYPDGMLDDTIDHQIAINFASRFNLRNLAVNATPKTIVNPDIMNASELEGDPEKVAKMKPNLGPEIPASAAMYQHPGSELSGAMQTIEYHEEAVHQSSASTQELGGDTDPANRTMGGQQIAAQNARRRLGPLLQIGIEWELEVIYQCLELVQDHYGDGSRYQGLLGKYGKKEEEAFRQCNIRDEIDIRHQQGSEMPRSQEDDLMAFNQAAAAGGIPGGIFNSQIIPAPIQEYGLKLFNLPIDINDVRPAKRLANQRLDRLKKAFTTNPQWLQIPEPEVDPMTQQPKPAIGPDGRPMLDAQGQPQPSQETIEFATIVGEIASSIPIRPELDPHALLMGEYKEWALTDEGISACPVEQAVVSMWVKQHRDADSAPQQAAQQAVVDNAKAVNAAKIQQEAQTEALQADHKAKLEIAKADHASANTIKEKGAEAIINVGQYLHEKQIDKRYPDPKPKGPTLK
jgi:hypothetical protein